MILLRCNSIWFDVIWLPSFGVIQCDSLWFDFHYFMWFDSIQWDLMPFVAIHLFVQLNIRIRTNAINSLSRIWDILFSLKITKESPESILISNQVEILLSFDMILGHSRDFWLGFKLQASSFKFQAPGSKEAPSGTCRWAFFPIFRAEDVV